MLIKNTNKELKYCKTAFELEEHKTVKIDGMEYFTFKGYGSTFGNTDLHGDIMMQGCFKESLKTHNPSLLWQHRMSEPLGVFKECREDKKGLYVSGLMPLEDTLVKGRVIPQMKAGSVRTMSIGFTIDEYFYDKENDVYKFTKVKLWEVSLVTIPANPMATITDFKDLQNLTDLKAVNKYLKNNCGLSNKESNILISKVKEYARDEQSSHRDYEKAVNEFKMTLNRIGGKN